MGDLPLTRASVTTPSSRGIIMLRKLPVTRQAPTATVRNCMALSWTGQTCGIKILEELANR
jgi:hypothetical protein